MNDFFAFIKNKKKSAGSNTMLMAAFIIIFAVSCSPSTHKNEAGSSIAELKDTMPLKPPSSFSDSIIIHFPAAVFYNPDSLQLIKIKAITPAAIFESTMHEFFYQARNSRIVLKKYYPYIKIIEIKNARFLMFKKKDGETATIDLNTKTDACGLFIFDGKKAPQLADMTNIETELGFYFAK